MTDETLDEREAIKRAATAYDRLNERIEQLQRENGDLRVELDGKQARIDILEAARAEASTRALTLEAERDAAVAVKHSLVTLFNMLQRHIDEFVVRVPEWPLGKTREEKSDKDQPAPHVAGQSEGNDDREAEVRGEHI